MGARLLPDWPRMMRRSTLALYLDMPASEVEKEMMEGRLPVPVKIGGEDRWSRAQVDAALDRLTGDKVTDWRAKTHLYASRR